MVSTAHRYPMFLLQAQSISRYDVVFSFFLRAIYIYTYIYIYIYIYIYKIECKRAGSARGVYAIYRQRTIHSRELQLLFPTLAALAAEI